MSCVNAALDVLRLLSILQLDEPHSILTLSLLRSLSHPCTHALLYNYEPFALPPEPLDALFEANATRAGLDVLKARHPAAKPFTLLRFLKKREGGVEKASAPGQQCTRRTASGLQAGLQYCLKQS